MNKKKKWKVIEYFVDNGIFNEFRGKNDEH